MTLRKLTEKDVVITIEAEMDEMEIRGNAIASGDDEFDKKVEDELINRLNCGDMWAWAVVAVKAKFGRFEGVDYLGGCSYKDEDDFKSGGYYEDMKDRAIDDLNNQLEEVYTIIKTLKED